MDNISVIQIYTVSYAPNLRVMLYADIYVCTSGIIICILIARVWLYTVYTLTDSFW